MLELKCSLNHNIKEFLSHLEEEAREKAEQWDETLKSKLVEMIKGLLEANFNFILFSKWCCNLCSHTLQLLVKSTTHDCRYLSLQLSCVDSYKQILGEKKGLCLKLKSRLDQRSTAL